MKSFVGSASPARDIDSHREPASGSEGGRPSTVTGPDLASSGAGTPRRLFAGQRYFGLEAQALRAGAERTLARIAKARTDAPIDLQRLRADFRLDRAAGGALADALVEGGLLLPCSDGRYRCTGLLREYAQAKVVEPLARSRAKALLSRAAEVAAEINDDWSRNPFGVQLIAVSGDFMSRRSKLQQLSLWLVLRRRQPASRRWRAQLGKGDGLREIVVAMRKLSSFIVVRVVADRQAVHRPFIVVFNAGEHEHDRGAPSWKWLRAWSGSISRRLAPR